MSYLITEAADTADDGAFKGGVFIPVETILLEVILLELGSFGNVLVEGLGGSILPFGLFKNIWLLR